MKNSPFILLKLEFGGRAAYACFIAMADRLGVQVGENLDGQFVGRIYFELPHAQVPRLRGLHDGVAWDFGLLQEIADGLEIQDKGNAGIHRSEKVVDMELFTELDELVESGYLMRTTGGGYQLTKRGKAKNGKQ